MNRHPLRLHPIFLFILTMIPQLALSSESLIGSGFGELISTESAESQDVIMKPASPEKNISIQKHTPEEDFSEMGRNFKKTIFLFDVRGFEDYMENLQALAEQKAEFDLPQMFKQALYEYYSINLNKFSLPSLVNCLALLTLVDISQVRNELNRIFWLNAALSASLKFPIEFPEFRSSPKDTLLPPELAPIADPRLSTAERLSLLTETFDQLTGVTELEEQGSVPGSPTQPTDSPTQSTDSPPPLYAGLLVGTFPPLNDLCEAARMNPISPDAFNTLWSHVNTISASSLMTDSP